MRTKRLVEPFSVEQQQLPASKPAEVTRPIDGSGFERRNLRGHPKLSGPSVDLFTVLVDGVAVLGREDHVQLIECAERRQEVRKPGMTRPRCGRREKMSASNDKLSHTDGRNERQDQETGDYRWPVSVRQATIVEMMRSGTVHRESATDAEDAWVEGPHWAPRSRTPTSWYRRSQNVI